MREVKRAASVRMIEEGLKGVTVCKVLIISDASVRNRKKVYKNKGAEGLRSGYEGSKGYMGKSRKDEIMKYPEKQEHPSVEESRDYIEKNYGILYESEQSYYDSLIARINQGNLSISEKSRLDIKEN